MNENHLMMMIMKVMRSLIDTNNELDKIHCLWFLNLFAVHIWRYRKMDINESNQMKNRLHFVSLHSLILFLIGNWAKTKTP